VSILNMLYWASMAAMVGFLGWEACTGTCRSQCEWAWMRRLEAEVCTEPGAYASCREWTQNEAHRRMAREACAR